MTIEDATYAVVDSETGGLDPATCDLLEIGIVLCDAFGNLKDTFETLVMPTKPIPPENSAIHGLIEEDFVGAPSRLEAIIAATSFVPPGAVLVGHNASFDKGFLPEFSDDWCCSKRLAMHVYPDAPAWKNQVLRYYLGVNNNVNLMGKDPHRAIADCMVTAKVFARCLLAYFCDFGSPEDDVSELIEFANAPVELKRMAFGKETGKEFEEIDHGYLEWILKQSGMDSDVLYTARRELVRRGRLAA